MLRLPPKTNPQNLPSMHNPIDTQSTYPLHRLGQKLPSTVSGFSPKSLRSMRLKLLSSSQLFGEDETEDGDAQLDAALQAGETTLTEVDSLRSQAQAFSSLRRSLSQSSDVLDDIAKKAFDKVFNHDIQTLLGMSDMWKHRTPPTVLEYDKIKAQTLLRQGNGMTDKLQDQRELTLADCLTLFVSR